MTSGSVNVFGCELWYEKFGTGDHPILLIPGAIGTGRSDFGPQIQGPNAINLKKYTLIAVEPIGWGRSRPPIRNYDKEIYNNDAASFAVLMEALGYSSYSILGWSDGAKTALFIAARYPSRVRSCIVWGVVAYATEKDVKAVAITKNIKFWGQDLVKNYEEVYGPEWIKLWTTHMDFLERIIDIFPDGFAKSELMKIRCPVFVLHGDQDPIVDVEQPIFVTKNIPDARMKRFSKGSHNLHFAFPGEFKKLAEDFLEEADEEEAF